MRYKYIVLLIMPFLIFSACSKDEDNKQQNTAAGKQAAAHTVTVEEVIQVTSYSYLRVKENDKEYWMAVTKGNFETGQVLTYDRAMEMKNFASSELSKTFETIYFVDNLEQKLGVGSMTQPQKPVIEKENISLEPIKGGITIAQLYSNINSYNGKTVKVRGKVIKINTGIMDKNWIHLQDGTNSGDNFDLTITTNDLANIGDVVTFEGKIAADKDFGYGYAYKLIMENAKALKNL